MLLKVCKCELAYDAHKIYIEFAKNIYLDQVLPRIIHRWDGVLRDSRPLIG